MSDQHVYPLGAIHRLASIPSEGGLTDEDIRRAWDRFDGDKPATITIDGKTVMVRIDSVTPVKGEAWATFNIKATEITRNNATEASQVSQS